MRLVLFLLLCLAIPAGAQTAQPKRASTPVAYTMVLDARSGAVVPRLSDTRSRQARAVNRHLDSIAGDLRCLDKVDAAGHPTEYESMVRVAHAADDILSVYINFSGFCGGAHPINGAILSVTYDLRTGKEVPFHALFADYGRDSLAIIRTLFPELVAAAEALERSGRAPTPDEECISQYTTDLLSHTYFGYTLTAAGLEVEPLFPYVVRACVEVVVVPYARLQRFAAPGGLLERMAARPSRR